ncbi:peptidoglycan/LPS O-acetylase OafA/YrhL [Neomicrococcus aestuarii]|uniref:Peptidoglycan/LPS O-acetylase OafA/YrhL n=1 Tax=Neomicrococcus aestuarii TaxID=556325 RepID=A0A7W8TSU3_9MICC|nr:acyltransferase family protein [Neomicrococcus aestuarii]MBB5512138.1 peptidoglycan/LPS O-acetylase OafA/YrhL [Neomicrococcus aestuarii]
MTLPLKVTPPTAGGTALPAEPQRKFQSEIQGLRAIAVLLVVIYHLWPERLPGGFVGVDVFFVISGYLITSHIYREIQENGRLSLISFWARRIRRLLPLGFVVLLFSAIAAVLWVPSTMWDATFRQIIASALYVQNWVLASAAVDYSAQDESATVVQHFWSLSVEEQFYIFWPLVIVLLLFLFRKFLPKSAVSVKTILIVGLSLIGLASLGYSIWLTAYDPASAYFVTPTRIWEFVVGALVGLTLGHRQFTGPIANIAGWIGLLAVLASGVLYSSATPFPGYTALLPVLGTALVMIAGNHAPYIGVHRWLSIRPAKFLGDISYGLYLWHWPLIIVAPYILNSGFFWYHKIVVLLIAILLSWATKVWIEDPFRIKPWIKQKRRSYSFLVAGAVAITAVSLILPNAIITARQGPTLSMSDPCYGYSAMVNNCTPIEGEQAPNPSAAKVALQPKNPLFPQCQAAETVNKIVECRIGASAETATKTVAVMGDSHARAWLPMLDELGKKNNWSIRSFTRSACTPSIADRAGLNRMTGASLEVAEICTSKNREVVDLIAKDSEIDAIVVAASPIDRTFVAPADIEMSNPQIEGFTMAWDQWIEAGKDVIAINEVPRLGPNIPECVDLNSENLSECSSTIKESFSRDQNIKNAAETMKSDRFFNVDMTSGFCDSERCYGVIGTVITFHDKSHVSFEYAKSLAPLFEKQLDGSTLVASK